MAWQWAATLCLVLANSQRVFVRKEQKYECSIFQAHSKKWRAIFVLPTKTALLAEGTLTKSTIEMKCTNWPANPPKYHCAHIYFFNLTVLVRRRARANLVKSRVAKEGKTPQVLPIDTRGATDGPVKIPRISVKETHPETSFWFLCII